MRKDKQDLDFEVRFAETEMQFLLFHWETLRMQIIPILSKYNSNIVIAKTMDEVRDDYIMQVDKCVWEITELPERKKLFRLVDEWIMVYKRMDALLPKLEALKNRRNEFNLKMGKSPSNSELAEKINRAKFVLPKLNPKRAQMFNDAFQDFKAGKLKEMDKIQLNDALDDLFLQFK